MPPESAIPGRCAKSSIKKAHNSSFFGTRCIGRISLNIQADLGNDTDNAIGVPFPSAVVIQSINTFENGLYNYVTYQSFSGWTFQVAEAANVRKFAFSRAKLLLTFTGKCLGSKT